MSEEIKPTPEQEAADAFDKSLTGYFLLGKRLENWNDDRELAAQALGCKFCDLGAKDISAINRGKIYEGAANDAQKFFWILTLRLHDELTPQERLGNEWTVERAIDDPEEAKKAARAWAKELKFTALGTPIWYESYWKMIAILERTAASEFELRLTGGKKKETAKPDYPRLV